MFEKSNWEKYPFLAWDREDSTYPDHRTRLRVILNSIYLPLRILIYYKTKLNLNVIMTQTRTSQKLGSILSAIIFKFLFQLYYKDVNGYVFLPIFYILGLIFHVGNQHGKPLVNWFS